MRHRKLTPMNIGQAVSRIAHLVGKAGLMAIETKILLVTGSAVINFVLGKSPMIYSPFHTVRLGARQHYRIDEFLLVAFQTN